MGDDFLSIFRSQEIFHYCDKTSEIINLKRRKLKLTVSDSIQGSWDLGDTKDPQVQVLYPVYTTSYEPEKFIAGLLAVLMLSKGWN